MSDHSPDDRILIAHGSGGKLSHRLVEELFLPRFDNVTLNRLEDSACLPAHSGELAITTDSYVVDPLFFPGGDIGTLAVSGTVNDLVAAGAAPAYLTAGFILEEGLPLSILERVLDSMQATARDAGVAIVAGDTKVVPRQKADKLFINTAGVGFISAGQVASPRLITPGDKILINGSIGDHGVAVMAAREGLVLPEEIQSDCAPLSNLIDGLRLTGIRIHAMRDPTRGGVATTLNEIARAAGVDIELDEERLLIHEGVEAACEILGFDPLYLANEGKMLMFIPPTQADEAVRILRDHPLGVGSAIIGRVTDRGQPRVRLITGIGGGRILDVPVMEQLPRIC